jgi:hypothetical protein
MVNTTPQVGRIAIVQINSTTQAYAQGYNINESVSVMKEYVLEPSGTPATGWPAVVGAGQKSGTIDIDMLYIDNTIENLFEAMATVTVICGPAGSSGGNPKDTYTAIITKVGVTVKTTSYTVKKVSMEITGAPTHSTW